MDTYLSDDAERVGRVAEALGPRGEAAEEALERVGAGRRIRAVRVAGIRVLIVGRVAVIVSVIGLRVVAAAREALTVRRRVQHGKRRRYQHCNLRIQHIKDLDIRT